jgi:hypothetical protein
MEIRIYKDEDIVFAATIDDDGITDDSKKAGAVEKAVIENPGPGLPENGVYRIVFDGNGDTVITRIKTNLHKLVFAGPLYPVQNNKVYPTIATTTATTTLYTNSNKLTMIVQHNDALQTARINNLKINFHKIDSPAAASTTATSSKITLPQSDTIINGAGYFSFKPEQFFEPYNARIISIKSADDIALSNYIITPYKAPTEENGISIAERSYDLKTAIPINGKLNWILRAPGLKSNNGGIYIKDIQITYTRYGWWK